MPGPRNSDCDSTIVPIQLWDTPANFDIDQLDAPLGSFSTLVYVMDMQVRQRRIRPVHVLTRLARRLLS